MNRKILHRLTFNRFERWMSWIRHNSTDLPGYEMSLYMTGTGDMLYIVTFY